MTGKRGRHSGFRESRELGTPGGALARLSAALLAASVTVLGVAFPANASEVESLLSGPVRLLASSLPDESPCFTIEEIELIGEHSSRFKWLLDDVEPLLPRCLGVAGIDLILAHLGERLVRQGHVTSRVTLGQQTLASGVLTVRLHAGKVGRVIMLDADTGLPDERWGTWSNAFPTGPGQVLDVRDLEQGVEQMKRLPSQSVTTTLVPGDGADVSDVRIERRFSGGKQDNGAKSPGAASNSDGTRVRPSSDVAMLTDRLRGGLGIDNGGPKSLGRTRWSANVAIDQPLAVNDIVSLGLTGNAEHPDGQHRSESTMFDYSVPFGHGLWSVGMSRSRVAQNVQLTTSRVLSSNESKLASLQYQHVLWRTSTSKTLGHAAVSTRRSRSFLEDLELTGSRRRTTFIEAGVGSSQLWPNRANTEFGFGYRRGVAWLRAEDDLSSEAGGVTLRPRIWTLDASVTAPVRKGSATWSSAFKSQFTGNATTSLDQFAIGGRGTVRGFDGDAVLMAENGWTLRNELNVPLRTKVPGAEAGVYVALDVGRVWGSSDMLLAGHKLAGAALGVRVRWHAARFDVAMATPILKPEGFTTARLGAYLSGSVAF